jgi:hypothetical protein
VRKLPGTADALRILSRMRKDAQIPGSHLWLVEVNLTKLHLSFKQNSVLLGE